MKLSELLDLLGCPDPASNPASIPGEDYIVRAENLHLFFDIESVTFDDANQVVVINLSDD